MAHADMFATTPEFTIQPHPATTNDPADLARQGESAFAGGSNVFNTPGQNIPTAQVAAALEDPKTRAQVGRGWGSTVFTR